MTLTEFSDQFDVLLNAFGNQASFGEGTSIIDVTVDEYEKSVFLTESQKEFVRGLYAGNNQSGFTFEEKEQIREALISLVKTKVYTAETDKKTLPEGDTSLYPKHNFIAFELPEKLLYIIFEEVKFSSYISGCDDESNKVALVIPATHDDLWHRMNNPFRGPYGKRVLRLNLADNLVELVSDHPIGSYVLRYVQEPTPIILTKLPEELSIEGVSDKTECMLPESTHSEILNGAVRLALQSKNIGRIKPKEEK